MIKHGAILGIDVGTSALKAVIYDLRGQVMVINSQSYAYTTPKPGWAEIDPELWWQAFLKALEELHKKVPQLRDNLQAVSFTGQDRKSVV